MIAGVDPISLGVLAPPGELGADIAVGTTQPLGVHMNCGGGVGGFIASRDEERYAREYPTLQVSICGTTEPGERGFGITLFEQTSYGSREEGNDWTGNSVYLWAIANAAYMAAMGPPGFAEIGHAILQRSHYAAARLAAVPGVSVRLPHGFLQGVRGRLRRHGPAASPRSTPRCADEGSSAARTCRRLSRARPERAVLRDRDPHPGTTSTGWPTR